MRDSDTYLAILDEGQEIHAKKIILLLGADFFEPADKTVLDRVHSITDLGQLDRIIGRMLKSTSWDDLLDTS